MLLTYSLMGILAMIVHLIINYRLYLKNNLTPEDKIYRRYLFAIFVYYLSDTLWGVLNDTQHFTALYIDTVAYYISMAYSVLICCKYIISYINLNNVLKKILNTFGFLYGFAVAVILIVNHFYHLYFWFDESGKYVAMDMRDVALVAQICMFTAISVVALVKSLKQTGLTRSRDITISVFGFTMALFLVFQGFYPMVPFYTMGLMIGTIIIHVFIHNEELSLQLKQNKSLNRELVSEQVRLQRQKDKVMTTNAIIEGLCQNFHSIWWAEKKDMKLHVVRSTHTLSEGLDLKSLENLDGDLAMRYYIDLCVVDEDKERMRQKVNTKVVLEQLEKADVYTVNYMRKNDNVEKDYNQAVFANAVTADGKELMVFGFRDINDIMEQELQLNKERAMRMELAEAKRAAEMANEMKTKFLQNMSHEIRTPLNAMFGFAQLLGLPDGSCTEEEKTQYNAYIYNSYRMLEMLISDIIDIADSEHGNYRLEISDVNINEACRNAIMSVEFRVPATVRMYMTSDFADDFMLRSDERRIQQVLINYLTNACKNTQEGEIHLHVSKTEHPGRVTFSVTDTGRGVPEEKAEAIFGRFTKLNQFVQGSGLGLSICQTIAEKLHGEVYLDTTYKKGARFVFVLQIQSEL